MNNLEMRIAELEQIIKEKDEYIEVLKPRCGICDICETNTQKELNEVRHDLQKLVSDLAVERKINDEISEDLRLAKKFIDWILIEFKLTNYNWLEDQNEISTILCDMKRIHFGIQELKEKLDILDAVGDTEENMRSFIKSIREVIDDYTKNIQEGLNNGD